MSAKYLNIQIASPACTELEVVMMDWLGKALQLPEEFLSGGKGGGVIQVKCLSSILQKKSGQKSDFLTVPPYF